MFALVVPTRNRPAYLARLLEYYVAMRFEHPIVIADASTSPDRETIDGLVARARRTIDVTCQHAAYDEHWAVRIGRALETLTVPYVGLCGDDDFVVPSGLQAAATFLEGHPDHAIAHGRACVFTLEPTRVGGEGFSVLSQTYKQRAIELDDPGERLVEHLGQYNTTFYSLHRRVDLARNMRLTFERAPDYVLGELFPSSLSILQGKSALLPCLYLVRQDLPTSTGKSIETWAELVTSNDYPARLEQFVGSLAEELARVGGGGLDDARATVRRALVGYLRYAFERLGQRGGAATSAWVGPRLSRALRLSRLVAAATTAALDGHVLRMVRYPASTYACARQEAKKGAVDPMALYRLLDPSSPDHAAFLPIHDLIRKYPHGNP